VTTVNSMIGNISFWRGPWCPLERDFKVEDIGGEKLRGLRQFKISLRVFLMKKIGLHERFKSHCSEKQLA
jgi:hypothetical protein